MKVLGLQQEVLGEKDPILLGLKLGLETMPLLGSIASKIQLAYLYM